MKKVNIKPLYIVALLLIAPTSLFSQSEEWKLEQGKATVQRAFPLQGKTASEVYKEINRWLVKYFRDPEDNLKARIEDEYIRGVGYQSNFLKEGSMTAADLQYSFIIDISKDDVIVKITDVILLFESTQDVNSNYRLEEYLQPSKKKKKSGEERVIVEMTNFSNAFFLSFQDTVFPTTSKL